MAERLLAWRMVGEVTRCKVRTENGAHFLDRSCRLSPASTSTVVGYCAVSAGAVVAGVAVVAGAGSVPIDAVGGVAGS